METLKRAIIVAAGEGTRLRPVTLTTPKPLVEVNGVRMIDTAIRALKKNGIQEIYIVAGYKKERFYDAYQEDPAVTILENPHYLEGNNITSLYEAREYLPGAFVLEGDLIIENDEILRPEIERSGYCGIYMQAPPEWALKMENGLIKSCVIDGLEEEAYRLMGISMWTEADGRRLAELIRAQIEDVKDWTVYWDELALSLYKEQFALGVRDIRASDILEIDTVEELAAKDPRYAECLQ